MPPTAAQFQTLVLQETNLVADTTAAAITPIFWLMYDDKDDDFTRYLYVKKRLILYLMSQAAGVVDIATAFDDISGGQWSKALKEMLNAIDIEIKQKDPAAFAGNLNSSRPYVCYPDTLSETLNVVEYYWNYFTPSGFP